MKINNFRFLLEKKFHENFVVDGTFVKYGGCFKSSEKRTLLGIEDLYYPVVRKNVDFVPNLINKNRVFMLTNICIDGKMVDFDHIWVQGYLGKLKRGDKVSFVGYVSSYSHGMLPKKNDSYTITYLGKIKNSKR